MTKVIKVMALGSLLAASALYGSASTTACAGCHGQHFEKKAMGKSKVVKDMSEADILVALKGYKNGTYGGAMKGLMKGQVASLSDADMKAIAASIKGGAAVPTNVATENAAAAAVAQAKVIDINKDVCDPKRIDKEDLGNKKVVDETVLGLRKTSLFDEKVAPVKGKEDRPAPGTAPKFERAYVNAPPMIPHSVEGLLPITKDNNQCLGCHMPDVAKGVGATPIPPSHFTNYRPTTVYKNGELVKEGKKVGIQKGDMGNVGDIKLAKVKKLNHLYQGRFNCSQCHAPQANVKTAVANTFKSDGLTDEFKTHSNLVNMMDDGVK
ncbi:nitrate reductase cytochrome c-type subunit [Sulfurovum sp. NBC37-1]|uniref:nitrate reductase cytochrome c-type subunit n=1 Tax=Sulfurovum sp. (strain NBC37-1) TaxID=387093 RepID=UPI0001587669|nr:periplasmic nitrate reductase, small subunit [Sulfurovum sp. NBC37-1]